MNSRDMAIEQLIKISRFYGENPEYVLLGGGNTSWKDEQMMYVKASGYALGSIDRSGFASMSMEALNAVWDKEYSSDEEVREQQVLTDMMDARMPGETARPSVEALLHSFIPSSYVVHLHPALVNGLTCGKRGKAAAEEMFGDSMVWVPSVNPGYILAREARSHALNHQKKTGGFPELILLENHGVFIGADTPEGIKESYTQLMNALKQQAEREPDLSPLAIDSRRQQVLQQGIRRACSDSRRAVVGMMNHELERFLTDREACHPLSSAFTPDHLLYSGHTPLWVSADLFERDDPVSEIEQKVGEYEKREGVFPKSAAVQHTGIFGIGSNARQAESACLVFLDTLKTAVYSESFGGPSFMSQERIDFIRSWEVERYRAKVQENQ